MAAIYRYRAVDGDGVLQRGNLLGEGEDSVAERVRRMGLRPVEVRKAPGAALWHRDFKLGGGGSKRLDALALFSRQFSTMTGAGTPLLRALTVLERQAEDKRLAEAIALVRADVENGDQLSVALARQGDWFDELYVSMVEAGEGAGALPEVLERLAEATEAAASLRRRVRSAMSYPVAVGGLIGLTVMAMLLFLIPTFEDIYADLDGKLPIPTRVVLGLSRLLTGWFPLVAGLSLVGWLAFRRWRRTERGARRVDAAKLRVPVFGGLFLRTSLARFSRSLSVLVGAGVGITEALRIARSTASNKVVSAAVEEVQAAVTNGGRLADAMAEQAVFTPMAVQMVGVGEETGALDEMLARVADLYDAEVDATVGSLTALVEPLLLVMLGVSVGGVLVAVYLPMFRAVELVQ